MSDQSISRFWDDFINKTKAYGVKQSAVRWYVRHAESYIKAYPDLKLAKHSTQNLEKYLKDKGRKPYIKDWQFMQIVDSLKILFVEMVKSPWAANFSWEEWANAAQSLGDNHVTLARDYQPVKQLDESSNYIDKDNGLFRQVYVKYPEHVNGLIVQIQVLHYSIRTERSYVGWLLRFISYHDMQDPAKLNEVHIAKYLEWLVIDRKVSSSTQRQALNALVFFYKKVLNRELSNNIQFPYSKKPRRLPVVLTRQETRSLLEQLENTTYNLMANLLYGCGMCLMEVVRLRVLDVDFGYQQILIREAKGKKDRVTLIPNVLLESLKAQIENTRTVHAEDIEKGLGSVYLPEALARKYPNAASEFKWQYVFPSATISKDPRSGIYRRHHIHENGL